LTSLAPETLEYERFLDGESVAHGRDTSFYPEGVGTKTIRLEVTEGPRRRAERGSEEVSIVILEDFDRDGLPNVWELQHQRNPFDPSDGDKDHDNDIVTTSSEMGRGTDPRNPDSDGDGILDGPEILQEILELIFSTFVQIISSRHKISMVSVLPPATST